MKQELGSSENEDNQRVLVILFGTLEFDGRVKRMVELLQGVGTVTLVDLVADTKVVTGSVKGVRRISINVSEHSHFKFANHLRLWIVSVKQALRLKPRVVVAEDYFTCFPAWVSAKLTRSKLIYDAHELIIPEPGLKMGLRNLFWYILERWVVKRCDLVVAANRERARLMAEHYDLKSSPEFMRNIPPRKNIRFSPEQTLRAYPELARKGPDDCIVLYQGDVNLARGLGRFIEALEYLPHHFRLIVAGGGHDLDRVRSMAERFTREGRFVSLGRVENEKLPSITILADVGIVCYPFHGLNNINCAPNKLFEYAQAGLPVVATDQPPLKSAIEAYGIGAVVQENSSAEQIAKVLCEVFNKRLDYRKRLEFFLNTNRWDNEAARVQRAIKNILSVT